MLKVSSFKKITPFFAVSKKRKAAYAGPIMLAKKLFQNTAANLVQKVQIAKSVARNLYFSTF